jgi:hypothetical protein
VADFCFRHVLQFQRADNVVFVSVGFKNVLDLGAFFSGKIGVDFAVSAWWINNDCFAFVREVVAVVG